MKNAFLVYETDCNHSHASKVLVGIFDSQLNAINAIAPIVREFSEKEFEDGGYKSAEKMYFDAMYNLTTGNQTQEFGTNFIIDNYETGKLF